MKKSTKVKTHKRKTKNGYITVKGFVRGFLGKIEEHSPVVKKRKAKELEDEKKIEEIAAKYKEEREKKKQLRIENEKKYTKLKTKRKDAEISNSKAEYVAKQLKGVRQRHAEMNRRYVIKNSSNGVVARVDSKDGVKLKPGQYIVDTQKGGGTNNGRKWKHI